MTHQTTTVAFFDIAGTLISGNPWRYLFADPRISRVQLARTFAPVAFHGLRRKVGMIDDARFRHQWITLMAGLVRGWSRDDLAATFAGIVQQSAANGDFHADVIARVQEHRARGDHVVLVSGMFDLFVGAYVAHLPADGGIGSPLGFAGDRATGAIAGSTINGDAKLDAIRRYLVDHGFSPDLSRHVAYADSLSDLPMLAAVGQAVATHPEPALHQVAKARGWSILGAQVDGAQS